MNNLKGKFHTLLKEFKKNGVFGVVSSINTHLRYIDSPLAFVPGKVVSPRPALVDIFLLRYKYGFDFTQSIDLATTGERNIIEDLLTNIRSDDVFYDIGAGYGNYSMKVAPFLNDTSNVVAVEPGERINQLINSSNIYGYNITTINKSVSTGEDTGYSTIIADGQMKVSKDEQSDGDPLGSVDSTFFQQCGIKEPDIIKIDVNGWELDVLKALYPLMKMKRCRLIYIEIEPPSVDTEHRHPPIYNMDEDELENYFDQKWSFDKMLILLTRAGFRCEYIMDNYGDLFIKASK